MASSRLSLLPAVFVTLSVAAVASQPALAGEKETRRLERATEAYRDLVTAKDKSVPKKLLDRCVCVAVIPGVIKAALAFGGRHGKGVVSCRKDRGKGAWSPPSFIKLSGGSFGLQIGAQSTDVVLFFMTKRGAKSLIKSEFTLGGQASVAAGPVGRTAEAGTDITLDAEVYSYARSRGLFAGLSLEGANLSPHWKANGAFYGRALSPEQILFEHEVPKYPTAGKRFIAALP